VKGWKTYKLEDAVDKLIDYRGKTPQKTTSGIPLVTAKVIKAGRIETPNEFIAEEMYDEWMTRGIPEYGDVVLTTEAPLGEVAQIRTTEKIALAQRVITLRGKKNLIDSTYLKYFLQSPIGQENLKAKETGSTVTGIKQSELRQIEIYAPDFKTQDSIASILSSLDNKIELNLQMNQTLEAMAQAIFKEWFVNFNFPGFDGKLVNGLPKGWRMGRVSDICVVNKNTLSIKDEIETIEYIEISEVSKGIINEIATYSRGEEPSRARRKLKHGDTVVSTVRPDRGSYFLAIAPKDNLIASTGFAVFSPISVPFSFLYCLLTSSEQMEFYGKMADGATYPAINPSIIMNIELAIPSDEVLQLFHLVIGNLYLKINQNFEENRTLNQLRDGLLPKLMTGQIEVKG
jgi:type I restriction enzyme S subunit